jgi:hypothetical protein
MVFLVAHGYPVSAWLEQRQSVSTFTSSCSSRTACWDCIQIPYCDLGRDLCHVTRARSGCLCGHAHGPSPSQSRGRPSCLQQKVEWGKGMESGPQTCKLSFPETQPGWADKTRISILRQKKDGGLSRHPSTHVVLSRPGQPRELPKPARCCRRCGGGGRFILCLARGQWVLLLNNLVNYPFTSLTVLLHMWRPPPPPPPLPPPVSFLTVSTSYWSSKTQLFD